MNIFDWKHVRKGLRAPADGISEKTYGGVKDFDRVLPLVFKLLCGTLMIGVLLLMIPACGKYKQDLENAKEQIEKLNAEIKRLTEETARFSQEKSELSHELKTLSDRNAVMQQELEGLNKAKARLSTEDREIREKNTLAEKEIASLRSEKSHLAREVEQLKKEVAQTPSTPKSTASMPAEVDPRNAKQLEKKLSPCDAVIAFMNASEAIITQQKRGERTNLLEEVKQQYAEKMKGAPDKAKKEAENWVKEYVKQWDQSTDDGVFRLLQLRGSVLKACRKSPDDMRLK